MATTPTSQDLMIALWCDYESKCPACGDFIDYCPGHGEIGDPDGYRILDQHDSDEHRDCDPEGCEEADLIRALS